MSEHIGRSFDGHPLEDACPCPQEPCGLIDVSHIDPACAQHALHAGKTIRQAHTAERCPMTATTSPKPHTPADPTVSKDPATTLDNGARDEGLRTALTKLADEWDRRVFVHEPGPILRDLLNFYPAPVSDTRREDVARVRALALRTADGLDAIGDPVIEAWDGEQFTTADLRALAALPALPVVDEEEIAARSLVALSRWIDGGNAGRDPEAVTWGRLAKITEEAGEVIAAFIGATGQNPRKGVTHDGSDVTADLLDVAVTALGAYEHLTDHQGRALSDLNAKITSVAERAGLPAAHLRGATR